MMIDFEQHREAERRLVDEALSALHETTGLEARLTRMHPDLPDGRKYRPDAQIDLVAADSTHTYFVEFKSFVDRRAQVEQVKQRLHNLGSAGMMITPYVSRDIAEYCKEIDLQFVDTHGNSYLRGPGVFVYVAGAKNEAGRLPVRAKSPSTNPAGLRVAFVLLSWPELVNAPYKDIARRAGVSLGTANNAFEDLERRGYLINKGDAQRRRLLEPRRLLEEWVINYPISLRPKLNSRRFSTSQHGWWEHEKLEGIDAVWGGEVAAEHLTRYLKPATQTLYVAPAQVSEAIRKLAVGHRLRPDPKGEVEILDKFWEGDFEKMPGNAPPLLVYSELLALLDPRASETAAMIKEKWIDPTLD
jgi:hypothetical protein